MIEKVIYYNNLYTIYGNLLTSKSAKIFSLYYEENLTMQEIADMLKVTKSFIGNSIKSTEKKLDDYETKLQILKKQTAITKALENDDLETVKKEIKKIIKWKSKFFDFF